MEKFPGVESLEVRLGRLLNMQIEVTLNENRTIMLSLLERTRNQARLSLHKLFLEAPDPVIGAIAHYVRGTRKERPQHNLILRKFIQEKLAQADLTHLVDDRSLSQQGQYYDLKKIYDSLNTQYFANSLDLSITWFGKNRSRPRTRVTFGQYLSGLRLIKIHRMLDAPFFPAFFVTFVVYHEMLHSVVPGSVDKKGRRFCFHTADFKAREKEFEYYTQAVEWEKSKKEELFCYGWT